MSFRVLALIKEEVKIRSVACGGDEVFNILFFLEYTRGCASLY
jgi:hypothetical protein